MFPTGSMMDLHADTCDKILVPYCFIPNFCMALGLLIVMMALGRIKVAMGILEVLQVVVQPQ